MEKFLSMSNNQTFNLVEFVRPETGAASLTHARFEPELGAMPSADDVDMRRLVVLTAIKTKLVRADPFD
jgi:hypothetical protein